MSEEILERELQVVKNCLVFALLCKSQASASAVCSLSG